MTPERSLPCSQEVATSPYPQPYNVTDFFYLLVS